MKKVIFIIAIAAITAAGLLYEPTVKNEANNDITVENAEALATKEKWPVTCCCYPGICYITDEVYLKTIFVDIQY